MIRIITVDDHPIVLEGLKNLLLNEPDVVLEKQVSSGKDTLQALREFQPDIILLDINLPDINGIVLCGDIRKTYNQVSIVVLSNSNDRNIILSAVGNGASGYILKNTPMEEIPDAIRKVHDGGIYFCTGTQKVLNNKSSEVVLQLPHLTRREKEVLSLIGQGNTSQEIASQLFISTYTVDGHRKKIMEKFKVNSMAAVIKIATENSLM
ncbi:response regulator transcription factor [Chitinophaga sp. HK235]|uniref:response regulator transcription factor n=1 Tax=Chitinophaga sp. HK235 TaxID=2952571 RepID=UPI001BA47ED8|nr:response regulator transcription factor [Chitinophaga sp. HK235]